MASPRRNARTVVVATCLLTTFAVPLAAEAAPPDHAPAHGHEARQGGSDRARDARPPAHARANGHTSRQGTSGRTTASASSSDADTSDRVAVAGEGRARGHAHAPGQARKQSAEGARAPQSASGAQEPPGQARKTPSPSTPDGRQAGTSPSAEGRGPVPPTSEPRAQGVAAPSQPEPRSAASTAPSETVPPATSPGRRVWRLDIDGPFADLLEDVRTTIDRVIPQDLGPVREPLVRLVPVLLAILGAFLALQRGIGRGLGHVPMVASPALYDPPRRD